MFYKNVNYQIFFTISVINILRIKYKFNKYYLGLKNWMNVILIVIIFIIYGILGIIETLATNKVETARSALRVLKKRLIF